MKIHLGVGVPTLQGPISHRVQNSCISTEVGTSKSVQIRYLGRRVLFDFFFSFIRYGDIAEQSACTVSRSIRASELDIQCMGDEYGTRMLPKI